MLTKALITDFSWRTEAQQIATLAPKVNFDLTTKYFGSEGRSSLVRPTQRKEFLTIFVASLACLSDDEDDLIDFLRAAKKCKLNIVSVEENFLWYPERSLSIVLRAWKAARNNGAAKIGARISADKKKARTKIAVDKIQERWPLPSSEWRTADLLAEAGVSLNTAKAHLGKRPIAQYNYQAAQKRKERRDAKR